MLNAPPASAMLFTNLMLSKYPEIKLRLVNPLISIPPPSASAEFLVKFVDAILNFRWGPCSEIAPPPLNACSGGLRRAS